MNSILVFSLLALISIGTLATASAQYSAPICGFGFTHDSKSARELIRCFQENPNLLEVEPNMAYNIGSAYKQLGDNQKAIKYFEFDLNYDTRALTALCYVYLDMKDYDIAYNYAKQAKKVGHDGFGDSVCYDHAQSGYEKQQYQMNDIAEMQELLDKALAEKEAANKAAAEKWEREQAEAEKRAMEEKAAEIDARLAALELAEKQAEERRLAEEAAAQQGGGCLIATATFGSEMAPQVQFLREIRDNTVLQTQSGTSFMTAFNTFYYTFSPTVADYERENPVFKEAVKVGLTPLLTSLTILNYVDIDTEQEMLGYGIGIIMLNIGMYFVAPAVVIIALKNRRK